MKRLMIAMTAAAVLGLLSLTSLSATAQTPAGMVTVVHGVPGLTVDVYVNGDLTLEDFGPGTVTDPLELPPGEYGVEIFAAGADPAATEPAISETATLAAGANVSAVAHLSAAGEPMLTVFANDTSAIAAGEARLAVRHTAAAPAVDVLANGSPLFTNLVNPNEVKGDVPAGAYEAAVAATGTTEPVLGPTDLTLADGSMYIVYAIGSLEDDSLDLAVQTISGLSTADSLPAAGFGPSGDSAGSTETWTIAALALFGLVFVTAGAYAAVTVRNR